MDLPCRAGAADAPQRSSRPGGWCCANCFGHMLAATQNPRVQRWILNNDFELVEAIAKDVIEWLGVVDDATRFALIVAVSEALSNAILHGNLELSSVTRETSVATYLELANVRRLTEPYS